MRERRLQELLNSRPREVRRSCAAVGTGSDPFASYTSAKIAYRAAHVTVTNR